MCCRYYSEKEDIEMQRYAAEAGARMEHLTGENAVVLGETFPMNTAAVLACGRNGVPGAYPMRWGFTGPEGKRPVINARSETAAEKPMFRESMLLRRCLIPAAHYFEWEGQAGRKTRYAIRPALPGMMFLAGIYRFEPQLRIPVFTVLTREAAPGIAFIHDRMPVMFMGQGAFRWLDRRITAQQLLPLCETETEYAAG